jgi:hypothetical protein
MRNMKPLFLSALTLTVLGCGGSGSSAPNPASATFTPVTSSVRLGTYYGPVVDSQGTTLGTAQIILTVGPVVNATLKTSYGTVRVSGLVLPSGQIQGTEGLTPDYLQFDPSNPSEVELSYPASTEDLWTVQGTI